MNNINDFTNMNRIEEYNRWRDVQPQGSVLSYEEWLQNNMEPEKKDVWEEKFDKEFCKLRHDGYMELKNHHAPDIKSFIRKNFIPRAEVVERLNKIIMCKKCNGQGAILGDKLGVLECEDCGGDGHCLYNREGEKLDDLLDLLTQ